MGQLLIEKAEKAAKFSPIASYVVRYWLFISRKTESPWLARLTVDSNDRTVSEVEQLLRVLPGTIRKCQGIEIGVGRNVTPTGGSSTHASSLLLARSSWDALEGQSSAHVRADVYSSRLLFADKGSGAEGATKAQAAAQIRGSWEEYAVGSTERAQILGSDPTL
eukprot:4629561-Pleurochrysis_carterae.AAC.1